VYVDFLFTQVRTLEMVTKRLGLKQCENIRELIHTEKNDLIRYGGKAICLLQFLKQGGSLVY